MFLNLFRTDLLKGYRKIQKARRYLLGKWRFELLRAYTRRWDKYAQELARRETRRIRFQKQFLPWIGVVLLLLAIGGIWLSLYGLCIGTILFMLLCLGGLTTLGVWFAFILKPKPPENPIEQHSARSTKGRYVSPIKQKLFSDPVDSWELKMFVRVPSAEEVKRRTDENKKYGEIGEFAVVREFERTVSPDTFILHSLQQKHGNDLDVVLVGPKGIWYFEVKHDNAEFEWQTGKWSVWRVDHKTRRRIKDDEWNEYPDAQWTRMRNDALKTLELHGKDLPANVPGVKNIKGGIVFSNVKAEFNIHPSAPFQWGRIGDWVDKYRKAPRLKEMTPEVVLQLIEILTKRHQDLHPDIKVYSMDAHVMVVVQDMEKEIQKWIAAS